MVGLLAAMGKKEQRAKGKILWNPKGYAFLSPQDSHEDIFIPAQGLNSAMDGDVVEVRVYHDRKGLRGSVTAVLSRAKTTVTGRYTRMKKGGLIQPLSPFPYTVKVPPGFEATARSGDIVTASIIPPKSAAGINSVAARVDSLLNIPEDVGDDLRYVATKHGIPWSFPDEVEIEAERVSHVDVERELSQRVDLRERVLFTIDGSTAQDFDDAVGLEKNSDGTFLLTVAIADVSHLVRRNSSLDREAFSRGFSVYFPETAIPMLPHVLSNGAMSLKPGEDRLAVVAEIHLGPRGRITGSRCYEAVIRSRARLTYEEINPFLEGTGQTPVDDQDIMWRLTALHSLTSHLSSRRRHRGSLDLDVRETVVILNSTGTVGKVSDRERGPGERLIEEAMLCANQVVCSFLQEHDVPVLYRVHECPRESDLQELYETLREIGMPKGDLAKFHRAVVSGGQRSQALQAVSDYFRNSQLSGFVNQHILRALMRARYSHEDLGHFGLATSGYLHFTSPIRRYPDLVIHRLIKRALQEGPMTEQERIKLNKYLKFVAGETSRREEITDEAMMEVTKLKIASYMAGHIGGEFSAVVTSIFPYGAFVEVLDPPVGGLIPSANRGRITGGQKKGRSKKQNVAVGEIITVRLTRADRLTGQLDFLLVRAEKNA
ncbi:MAG TPA: VacB/RNase II family 3'-5' exoribonuclease [Deltaproteobacteria bacterium]|nr:VacB/RNase II family 3'-5' exoribonuclease [Deltaproteobacteria bacterium]